MGGRAVYSFLVCKIPLVSPVPWWHMLWQRPCILLKAVCCCIITGGAACTSIFLAFSIFYLPPSLSPFLPLLPCHGLRTDPHHALHQPPQNHSHPILVPEHLVLHRVVVAVGPVAHREDRDSKLDVFGEVGVELADQERPICTAPRQTKVDGQALPIHTWKRTNKRG